jgi:outer membrane protein insertion porin family
VIDDGIKEIGDLYHNTGYIYARVEPELVERADRVADVVIHINEGEQFKVGRIEFQGNDRTMDKVLRRELRLWEEGLVNIGAIRNSVLKVNQLGYFKLNEEDPVDIQTDSDNKKVNLVFKGAESDRTELQFGGGWSEFDGFFGQFSVNTKNFLGRGEQVGVSVQSGKVRKYFDLSYYIPSSSTSAVDRHRAFNQNYDYGLLSTTALPARQQGGGAHLRPQFQAVPVGQHQLQPLDHATRRRACRSLPGETVEPPPAPRRGPDHHDPDQQLLAPPRLVFDKPGQPVRADAAPRCRSRPNMPAASGRRQQLHPPRGELQPLPAVRHLPDQTVIAVNAEAGLIQPLRQPRRADLQRYYLGGENGIRGHRFRSIFVRLPNGEPDRDESGSSWGDKFAGELSFPPGWAVRLILFGDGGNV